MTNSLIKITVDKKTFVTETLKQIRTEIKIYTAETLLFERRAELFCLVRNVCLTDFTETLKRLSRKYSTKINYTAVDDIYTSS